MSSITSILRLLRAHAALLVAELEGIVVEARRIAALIALSLLLITGGLLVLTAGFAVAAGQSAFGSGIWGAIVAGPLLATAGILVAGIALRAPRSLLLLVPIAGIGAGALAYLSLSLIADGRWVIGAAWTAGAIVALIGAVAVVRAADRAALRDRLLPTASIDEVRTTVRDTTPTIAAAAADVAAARSEVRGRPVSSRSVGQALLDGMIDGLLSRFRSDKP